MPLEAGERDRGFVLDMILSGEDALEFAEGLDKAAFLKSRLHQNAIIRAIEVVGEAASRLSPEFRNAHRELGWSEIIGMRHRLIHGYDKVSLDVVWDVVRDELPATVEALRRISNA